MSGYSLGDTSVKTSLKYGLNPAAQRKKKAAAGSSARKPLAGPIAAFAGADEEEDADDVKDVKARGNVEVLRQQAAAKRDQKVSERRSPRPAPPSSSVVYPGARSDACTPRRTLPVFVNKQYSGARDDTRCAQPTLNANRSAKP